MARLTWLRPPVEAVLQERPDEFWMSYQVWERLQVVDRVAANRLVAEYGPAVGSGGGAHVGPAWAISQCLGRWDSVEERYLNAQGLRVGRVQASASDRVAIFRMRKGC